MALNRGTGPLKGLVSFSKVPSETPHMLLDISRKLLVVFHQRGAETFKFSLLCPRIFFLLMSRLFEKLLCIIEELMRLIEELPVAIVKSIHHLPALSLDIVSLAENPSNILDAMIKGCDELLT